MKCPVLPTLTGGRLKISAGALGQMLKYAKVGPAQLEGGGVLLGRYILHSRDVVVDQVTEPFKMDGRSRFGFFRSARQHQEAISRAWRQSQATCNYLGEWHTHPEELPLPSTRDLESWEVKLVRDTYDDDHLYFVIVGTRKLRVWQGAKADGSLAMLGEYDWLENWHVDN